MDEHDIEITFEFEKSTKNTHRYQETDNDLGDTDQLAIGTLYIQKAVLEELSGEAEPPKFLTVTVTVG